MQLLHIDFTGCIVNIIGLYYNFYFSAAKKILNFPGPLLLSKQRYRNIDFQYNNFFEKGPGQLKISLRQKSYNISLFYLKYRL